jgi:hypothetical protein
MGSLALLLAIQLTIMSVHSAAVLASELIKGGEDRSIVNPVNEVESTEREGRRETNHGTANDTASIISPGQNENRSGIGGDIDRPEEKNTEKRKIKEESHMNKKQCPLCMDFVRQPAATPCGHVYCWSCVHKWVISDRNGNGNDRNNNHAENGIKCPVCRQLFQQHQIRALYCYS